MTASVLTRPSRALPAGARLIALAPGAAYAVRVLAAAGGGAALGTLASDGVDPSQRIVSGAAALADAIVAHALGAPGARSADQLRAAAEELARLLASMRGRLPASAAEMMPSTDDPPLALAQEWLQEAALERHAHALMLLIHPRYRIVLGVRALHPAEALGRTAERVLSAAEAWASHDELLEMETEAAYWLGERWSQAVVDESERAARSITRRMEWAFAERPTLAAGKPVLRLLLDAPEAAHWPAARRAAAEALVGSLPGAWRVARRTGDETAEVVSLLDGRELRIRDPYGEALPGRVLMGRALPSGEEYVFALSTELVGECSPGDLRALTADVRAFAGTAHLPTALAVEATIADGLFGARIPRPVRPAEDAEDALARVDE
ncbi:MAG TPA: hypothetical protein VF665_21195, partial [Longimicrobium sp.]